MKVFTAIDRGGEARARGLGLRKTKLVTFGDPKTGTPLIEAAPFAALDLPLKVVVFTDRDRTCVSYTKRSELAARYRLSDELAAGFTGVNALTMR
jgi:uncharacterized protein (DUF302 family)